jgi:hypothetical protein
MRAGARNPLKKLHQALDCVLKNLIVVREQSGKKKGFFRARWKTNQRSF